MVSLASGKRSEKKMSNFKKISLLTTVSSVEAWPSSSSAASLAVATTTPSLPLTRVPSSSTAQAAEAPAMDEGSTATTRAPSLTAPGGSPAAICSLTLPIPPSAGRQLAPVARLRITNSNSLLEVRKPSSKKIPPRKGLKKRSVISSEKPRARRASSVVVSSSRPCPSETSSSDGASASLGVRSSSSARSSPTLTLSSGEPIGCEGRSVAKASKGWRKGSATAFHEPLKRTAAPA